MARETYEAQVALLGDRELDTTATRHRDPALFRVTNDKHIVQTRRELTAGGIANVHNVKATVVTLDMDNLTGTANVTSTRDHDVGTRVELDKVDHLVVLEVKLDRVVDAHERVRVTERAAIVRHNQRHALGTELNTLDLEELVLRLLRRDAVHDKATLDVVQNAEVLTRLLNRHHILETSRVRRVGAHLVVDLDDALHGDRQDLTARESVLQAVTKQNLSG